MNSKLSPRALSGIRYSLQRVHRCEQDHPTQALRGVFELAASRMRKEDPNGSKAIKLFTEYYNRQIT